MVIVAIDGSHDIFPTVDGLEQNSCLGGGKVARLQPSLGSLPEQQASCGNVRLWMG